MRQTQIERLKERYLRESDSQFLSRLINKYLVERNLTNCSIPTIEGHITMGIGGKIEGKIIIDKNVKIFANNLIGKINNMIKIKQKKVDYGLINNIIDIINKSIEVTKK